MPGPVYRVKTRDEHFANDGAPKRILALDGGGLRGIATTALLEKIEDILRDRHGGHKDFRLCHYFDLIAGTSTGSIIAAALAQGWTAERIRKTYFALGESVFEKSSLRKGFIRAKYSEKELTRELKKAFGETTSLDSTLLKTGLLIVTKRIDTGSPWPISNNPRGKYFNDRPTGTIGNGKYPLWQVVRASTAAPTYFDPETIRIKHADKASGGGKTIQQGEFVDGGVSPFNNPSLQALMFVTLDGYRVGWPTGAHQLSMLSLGSGTGDPSVKSQKITAAKGITALASVLDDNASLQEVLMQWISSSATARVIDREIGDLQHDLLTHEPVLTYNRFDLDLSEKAVLKLDPDFDRKRIESLTELDSPDNMEALYDLATKLADAQISEAIFPHGFNLI